MPVLDPNVVFQVSRPTFDAGTNTTGEAMPYQSGYIGHLRQVTSDDYWIPTSASNSTHVLLLDEGVNIGKGDELTNIVRLLDGQPYEDDVPLVGQANSAHIVWRVQYADPTRMVSLAYRRITLYRVVASGPTHP